MARIKLTTQTNLLAAMKYQYILKYPNNIFLDIFSNNLELYK